MESERKGVIGLTEDQALAATLAALGLDPDAVRPERESAESRVLSAYREAIAAEGRAVTAAEVSRRMGLCHGRVAALARQLFDAGRMVRAKDGKSGKVVYLPKAGAE